MINFGRGMIFPTSYNRNQFSAEEEARQEAGQARAEGEARAEVPADAHGEGIEAAARALAAEDGDLEDFKTNAGQVRDYHVERAAKLIDAYLEALNARDAVTVTLSRDEAKQFVDDLRRLDAHVIAQSAGGVAPSKRRAEVRRKLLEALNAH